MEEFNPYRSSSQNSGHVDTTVASHSSSGSELDLTGLLQRIILVYTTRFLSLLKPVAIIAFLNCLIYFLIGLYVYFKAVDFIPIFKNLQNLDADSISSLSQEILGEGAIVIGAIFVVVVLSVGSQIVLQMITVLQVGNWELGLSNTWIDFAKSIMYAMPVFVVVATLFWIMIGFGFLFCILPGLFITIYYMMVLPQIITGKQSFNSIPESFYILKDRYWKTAGVFAILYIIQLIVSTVFTLPMSYFSDQVVKETILKLSQQDTQIIEAFQEMLLNPLVYSPYIVSIVVNSFWLSISAVASTVIYVNYANADEKRMKAE